MLRHSLFYISLRDYVNLNQPLSHARQPAENGVNQNAAAQDEYGLGGDIEKGEGGVKLGTHKLAQRHYEEVVGQVYTEAGLGKGGVLSGREGVLQGGRGERV